MKRFFPVLLVVACIGGVPLSARADSLGFQQHDGLLLRLTTGVGYGYASTTAKGKKYAIQGVSSIVDIGIGYCVIDNLALTADIFGGLQISPKFSRDGDSKSFSNAQLISAGFGLGATYYIMPVNLYLSLALGGSRMSLEYRASGVTVKGETRTGFGMHFGIGKEWWVSDNWGIGAAGQFFFMRVPDADSSWNDFGGGLAFTATYN